MIFTVENYPSMDEASELKRYYESLQKTFKRIKKRLESSPNNENHEIMTEMQRIKYSINRFQMQYGNFIKAQNNNFGEFNEDMFRNFLKSRRPSHDSSRNLNFHMSQPVFHQKNQPRLNYGHFHENQQGYDMMPQRMPNQPQYTPHVYGIYGNFQMSPHASMNRVQPPQPLSYKPFPKQFPQQRIDSPQLRQNFHQNRISSPIRMPFQKIDEVKRASTSVRQSPKSLEPISPAVPSVPVKKIQPPVRKIPQIPEKRQFGNFTEVHTSKNINLPDESSIRKEVDPSVFLNDNYNLNVTDICERAKRNKLSDAKNELEILKKKWQLNDLELTPDVQKELFKKMNEFLSSLLSISTSIARTTPNKFLERKHVEFAFFKLEKKLLPDSTYIPMNHISSKKHLKRINLLNESTVPKN